MMILHRVMRSVKSFLIFFNDLDFQKIKLNAFDKGILPETRFGVPLELLDIVFQPDRFA